MHDLNRKDRIVTEVFVDPITGMVQLASGLGKEPSWEPALAWAQDDEGQWKSTGEQKELGGVPVWMLRCSAFNKAGVPEQARLFALSKTAPTAYTSEAEWLK